MKKLDFRNYIGKSIEFRFIPNYFDQNNHIIMRDYLFKNTHVSKYFTYVYFEGEIQIMIFSGSIYNYLMRCIEGFYGTKDGRYIFSENIENCKYYYIDEYNTIIPLINNEDYFNDKIVYYPKFLPYDLTHNIHIKLNINEKEVNGTSLLEFTNIKLVEHDPINNKFNASMATIDKYIKYGNIEDFISEFDKTMDFSSI